MTDDLKGTEILGYRVLGYLGEGGMATVWRAEHPALRKAVAIKVLDPLLARNGQIVERFRTEAEVQCRLRHPHIVSVENLSLTPLAIVMEYVEGSNLAYIIERQMGPIPLERALPWMRQILAAVEHAHGQGVVHRDLITRTSPTQWWLWCSVRWRRIRPPGFSQQGRCAPPWKLR